MCTKKFLAVVVVAVLFMACKKESVEFMQGGNEIVAIDDDREIKTDDNNQTNTDGDNIKDAIIYPETGKYGDNLLSDNTTSWKIGVVYSLLADVPKGMDLKIVIRAYPYSHSINSNYVLENWDIDVIQYNEIGQTNEFIVIESGKISDLEIKVKPEEERPKNPHTPKLESYPISKYVTIEYYENDAKEPTKVKELRVD